MLGMCVVAILFNPLVPIHLRDKEQWIPIDIICAVVFAVYGALLLLSKRRSDGVA